MNEKMTDEELSLILARIRTELGHTAESDLSAHIAALTAERDEALTQSKGHRLDAEALARVVKQLRGLLGTDDDSRHSPSVVDATQALLAERDTIRERVQALEGERNAYRRDFDAELAGAKAIRARHGAKDDETFNQFIDRLAADSRALAAIRQRAGNIETLSGAVKVRLDRGETPEMVAAAVAHYILGDNAQPLAPPEAFTHEKGLDAGVFDELSQADSPADMTDEEARRICAEAGVDVGAGVAEVTKLVAAKREEMAEATPDPRASKAAHILNDVQECIGRCPACNENRALGLNPDGTRHEVPAPTTAEAFATVRAELQDEMESPAPPARAVQALSLLKRRMVAQQRALEETLKLHHRMPGDVIRMIQNALTDAPPLSTLGEVVIERACEVMHDAYEKAAKDAGWETQQRSRKPWAEVPEANKATMRAAVAALLEHLRC